MKTRPRARNTGLVQLPISSSIPKDYWNKLYELATTKVSRAALIRQAIIEFVDRRTHAPKAPGRSRKAKDLAGDSGHSEVGLGDA